LSSNEKLDLPASGDGTGAGNAELGSNGVGDAPSGIRCKSSLAML
jgi:tRNA pseudouridine38-40 synthase